MFKRIVCQVAAAGRTHKWLRPLGLLALLALFSGAALVRGAGRLCAQTREAALRASAALLELRRDDMEQRERGKERAGAAKPVRSFYRPAHRAAAVALSVCMVFTLMPSMAFAAEVETGLCEHHPEHTAECGYEPASPCEHEHDGDCYTDELICGFDEETEQTASGSDAGHTHTPDCYRLDCPHERGEHDETCGYSKGAPCTYSCELCNPSEAPSCLCDPQVTGEDGVHTDPACPFYENQAPVCLCDPQVTEPDGVHTSPDCPFYAEPDEIDALCAAIDALPTVDELYANAPGNQDSKFDAWAAETRARLAEVPALWERLSALTGDAAAMERITQDRADKLAALNDFAQLLGERETKEANGTAPGGSVSDASGLQTALGGPDNASVDGDTVTILKNIEIPRTSSQIKITGGNLTLDLNGHKLSALANINIVYVNGAQGFTLKDSSENQTGDLSGERVYITNTPFIVDGGNYGELNYINDNGQNYSISIKKGIFGKISFPTGISISTALKDASVFTTAGEIISAKQLEKNLLFLTNGEKIKVVPTTNISSVYLSGSGSDTGLGTAESPFRSFERAKSAVADNGTIYIQSTYFVSSASETWSLSDKPNVTVMRASGNTSKMISVSNNATLTLNSIVIDGGSSNAGTENGPIIEASYGNLVINTGTILQNNRGPAILMLYRSNATMNGGTIQNNTLLTSNGAVCVGGTSNIDFKGGSIQNNMNGEVDCSIAVSASQVTAKISPNLTVSGMISLDSSKLIFTGVPTTNYKLALGSTYIKTEGAVVVELASGVSGTLDLSKFTLDSEDFVLQMGTGETEGKIVIGKEISSLERLQQSIDNANGTDNNPTVISIPQSGIEVDTTLIIPVDKYIKLTGGALTRAETFNSKPLFDVKGQLTLTGITLDGNKDNANGDGLLEVDGGSLILDTGAILQNNKNSSGNGGAVRVCAGGSVIMNAGKISGNEATAGGGVYAFNYFDETGGTFTMNGGEISGNTAEAGSGVYITKTSTFNLHSGAVIKGNAAPETVSSSGWDGTIEIEIRPSANTFSLCDMPVPLAASYGITIPSSPDSWGGGVYNMGTFTMDGGEISDNTAGRGGAVYHADGTCTITGGTISGNHNTYSGTGLYAREDFSIGGSANIADGIYLVTGKKALVTSALSNSIQIEGMEGAPVTGTVVAAGSSYTISDTDFGKFSIKDNAWTLEKNAGGQICLKAPTSQQSAAPAFSSTTATFASSGADSVTFTLTNAASGGTYKVYATATGGSALTDPAVSVTEGVLALTFTSKPSGTTKYYISATAGSSTESDRTEVTVKPYVAPTYGVTLSPSADKAFTAAPVGYGEQTAHTVTVRNSGNQSTGDLTVALSGTNAGSFTLSTTSIDSIAAGGNSSFTVKPNTGLSAGTYTATVTVSGNNSISASFGVSFTVNSGTTPPATTYSVTYTLTNLTATNQPTSVNKNAALSATLTAASGYKLPDTITVTMGGTTLESGTGYTYNSATGAVGITSVTGDVVITASGVPQTTPPQQSDAKEITAFSITNQVGNSVINQQDHTIAVTMPADTDVTSLTPSITVSDKASVSPASDTAQNFTNPVTYTVTAENGTTQDYTVTVTVQTASATAPTITTTTLPNGAVGVEYTATLTATGDTPITWSVSAGSLPNGLTLSGATISGIPTVAGTFNFTVKAVNATSEDTQELSIAISAPEATVTGVTVSPSTATVKKGTTQQFSATVTGENGPAQTVTWAVAGGTTGTSISTSGLLTVASGETATTLTVTATSTVDGSKSGTATVTVTDQDVTRYTLAVTNGSGSGDYAKDAQITVTANTETGRRFKEWTATGITLANKTANPVTITMPANAVTLTATYEDVYAVTVTSDSNGTATASPATAAQGETVTLTATANSGYQFKEWTVVSGGITLDANASTSFTMPGQTVEVKAVFELQTTPPPIKYTLTVSGSYAGATGAGSYAPGATVTISAGSRSGYSFTGWTVVSGSITLANQNQSTTTFEMPATNVEVQANWSGNSTGGSDNGSSGSSGSSGGSGGYTPPTITDPKPGDKPNVPTTAETDVAAKTDSKGNAEIDVPSNVVDNAIGKALDAARKNGAEDNGVAVQINVTTGKSATGKAADTITVNLPKTTQERLIAAEVSSFTVVVNRPDIAISLSLDSIREIHTQANADVQLTATRLTDTSTLSAEARTAIGTRPVFQLTASYRGGKVTDFGAGSVGVEIPYTLRAGELAGNLYAVYVDDNGKVTYLTNSSYDSKRGVLMFTTDHFSTYGIGYKTSITFDDIQDHWAKEDIEFVASRGLLNGTGSNRFSPDGSMTRAMFVTALGRLAGIDAGSYKPGTFTDVPATAYYAPYVEWAAQKGIVQGTGSGKFSPDAIVTRQQMAAIMSSYAKAMGYTVPATREIMTFTDSASIAAWATGAVKQMQRAGVLMGKDGNRFDPTGPATRAQASTTLRRYIELVIDWQTTQGWTQNDSGSWMYYQDGKPLTGERTIGGTTYHFDANGILQKIDAVAPEGKKYLVYVVKRDDTLWDLAEKYGCTVAEIVALNDEINNPNLILVGQEIKIPQK